MAKRMQNLRQTGKEAALAGSVMMSHGGSEYRQDTKFQSLSNTSQGMIPVWIPIPEAFATPFCAAFDA